MRSRKLRLVTRIGGLRVELGTVTIKKFADTLKAETKLVCPRCNRQPEWHGGYDCTCCPLCGKPMEAHVVNEKGTIQYKCAEHGWQLPSHYNHWSQLKRVLPDGTDIEKPKLTTGETVEAEISVMDIWEFRNYSDATSNEYGLTVKDVKSAEALRKLLIASRNLGFVLILRWVDTYHEIIALLMTSISNRILLKEIIPLNLLDQKETMRIDYSKVSDADVREAEGFIKQLPKADRKTLIVQDYRLEGIELVKESPKIVELETILAKAK